MLMRIEIRVHAGAPSSKQDDDTRREQAEAYLRFQGVEIYQLHSSAGIASISQSGNGHPEARGSSQPMHEPTEAALDLTTLLEDTQLAYGALESQLLTSSLTRHFDTAELVVQSSLLRGQAQDDDDGLQRQERQKPFSSSPPVFGESPHHTAQRPAAAITPVRSNKRPHPSESAQTSDILRSSDPEGEQASQRSSCLKTPVLEPFTKKQRTADAGHRFYPRTPDPRAITLPGARQIGTPFVRDPGALTEYLRENKGPQDALHSREANAQETTSELPTTYSLSDITSENSRHRPRRNHRSISDPSPTISQSSTKVSQDSKRTRSEPASLERIPVLPPAPEKPPAAPPIIDLTSPSSSITPDALMKKQIAVQLVETLRVLHSLPLRIEPPEPEAANAKFTTHITWSLKALAESSDVLNCYTPAHVSRDIETLERGFWLIPIPTTWSLELQVNFWRFLEKYIGQGKAGWGVWCIRTPVATNTGLGNVRVCCWGEVVKHVYLLLYTASLAGVREIDARWIDAEGLMVVRMRS